MDSFMIIFSIRNSSAENIASCGFGLKSDFPLGVFAMHMQNAQGSQ
jgi:hypothetical protein